MAEVDAKINMSLDEIIKLERKEKKKNSNGVSGKKIIKRNIKKNVGNAQSRSPNKSFNTNYKKNKKNTAANAIKKRNQNWRFQRQNGRQTSNVGFVGKRYKQQNGVTKRTKNGISINKNIKQQLTNRDSGIIFRRTKTPKFGLTRSRSRNNLASNTLKNLTTNNRGLKRTNSLPNLRDPNSVHNRLGYQSLTQVAYRNRVKRAKKLLLQRQNKQKLLSDDQMLYRPARGLTSLQQRALERHQQQLMTSQRNIGTGGLRSDQILRSQRRAQYTQKLMRMNAPRRNPNNNVNFMCTLKQVYDNHPNFNPHLNRNMNNNLRQLPRGRSPYRSEMQNSMARTSQFMRPRSRSRSRSRSRIQPSSSMQSNINVDDRTFSQVMYSVSNNLGVTERTLNDRFSY
ncbi:myb-like protein D [Chelonus insularis]|uniref:myb-like protein D n=1 Tax=Chelonus insularis TaxID=460826 RepID=UPI0015888842|nr:myb-like protein D [Chelonus insularis]